MAFKIIGGIGGSIGGAMLMTLVPLAFVLKVFMILVFGLIGYLLPSVQIRSMANKRQNGIRRQLPDVMDL